MTEPITIRGYRPGDEVGLVDCYNAVFPLADHAVDRQDLALWRWKYDDSLTGVRHITVADHATEGIVGAYQSQALRAWMEGRMRLAEHIVDLMVVPKHRRHPPRPGLFVQLGLKFHELYCGRGDDRGAFTYGWAVPAWRIGQRYLGYQNIRDWNFLGREIAVGEQRRELPGDLVVDEVDVIGDDVDPLFERVRRECSLTIVRDRAYLEWRYRRHPRRRYRIYECRERAAGGRLRGLAVYTVGDFVRAKTSFLVDWVVPGDDVDAITALVRTAEWQARQDETGAIAGIWSPVDPRFSLLQRMGYRLTDNGYFINVVSFGHDTFFFRDNWIYTMGDSDLI